MQNTFYELAMWQERWCMENLPPLPLTTWVSPHYDPYEIDHTHYSNSSSNYDYDSNYYSNYDSYSNSSYTQTQYIEQYEPEYNHYYDTETDDDESLY